MRKIDWVRKMIICVVESEWRMSKITFQAALSTWTPGSNPKCTVNCRI